LPRARRRRAVARSANWRRRLSRLFWRVFLLWSWFDWALQASFQRKASEERIHYAMPFGRANCGGAALLRTAGLGHPRATAPGEIDPGDDPLPGLGRLDDVVEDDVGRRFPRLGLGCPLLLELPQQRRPCLRPLLLLDPVEFSAM